MLCSLVWLGQGSSPQPPSHKLNQLSQCVCEPWKHQLECEFVNADFQVSQAIYLDLLSHFEKKHL